MTRAEPRLAGAEAALRALERIQQELIRLDVPGVADGSLNAAIRAVGRLEGVLYSLRGLPESLQRDSARGSFRAGSPHRLSVPGGVARGRKKIVPSAQPTGVPRDREAKRGAA